MPNITKIKQEITHSSLDAIGRNVKKAALIVEKLMNKNISFSRETSNGIIMHIYIYINS